jgi:hypothetical protein
MDQMSIKYTIIFHCKTLQNLTKFVFLVWKQNHLATLFFVSQGSKLPIPEPISETGDFLETRYTNFLPSDSNVEDVCLHNA